MCYRRTQWRHQDTVTVQIPINMGVLVRKSPVFLARSIQKWTREAMYVRATWRWGAFVHPLLQCKSNKLFINIFRECVSVALGIHHLERMRHIFVYGLPGCTTFFPHYLINGTILEEKVLNAKCVFRLSQQLLSENFVILRRIERDMIIKLYWS